MGFIWFIVAVTFFILWLRSGGEKTRDSQNSYNKGYLDGQQTLISLITQAFHKNSLSKDAFNKIINPTAQPEIIPEQTAFEAEVESRGDPLYVEQTASSAQSQVVHPVKPARTKAEQANRNLNILLYTASFLIIAAAAAFIATSMPASVRLVGLWLVIMAFYIVGLVLHAKVTYLRSAAIAFVGTGLALIPFAGIALAQLGGLSEGWAWFVTSVVGLLCYAIATIRLNSSVVGYLTIAFSLSLAASTIATVSGPVVLYFVALIVMSLIFHILAHLNYAWIPDLFKRPIQHTGHLLTPLTLLGSLLAYDRMTIVSYEVVFWVATLYYVAILITNRKYIFEAAVRILLTISVLITAFDLVKFDQVSCLWIWVVVLLAQGIYSFVRVRPAEAKSRTTEAVWYWVIIALLVNSVAYWLSANAAQVGIAAQVSVMFVISVLMTWRLRSVPLAIPALIATFVLPFVIGRWPGDAIWSMEAVTYVFIGLAAAALGAYYFIREHSKLRAFLQVAFWSYVTIAFFVAMGQQQLEAWSLAWAVLILLTVAASYLYRQWQAEIISILLAIPVVTSFLESADVNANWVLVLTVGITASLYLLVGLLHEFRNEEIRRNLAVTSALLVGVGLIGGVFMSLDEAKVTAIALILAYAIIGLVARLLVNSKYLQKALTITYVGYPVIAFLITLGLEAGWFALVFGISTFIYAIATFAEKQPVYLAFANITLVGLVASLWSWLQLDVSWMFFGTVWISAVLIYASYLLFLFVSKDTARWTLQLISFWVILGIATLIYFWFGGQYGYGGAISAVVIGLTLAFHGVVTKRKAFIEAGAYVSTLGAQRIFGLALPELTILFYGHWWALTIASVAYWRRADANRTLRLVLATAAITISSGVMALASGGVYQIVFLVEHVILLVVGALSRTSWLLWWGLSATVLAVLYFLRSSLFLSLLFLGLTLISIVIWRLIRIQQKNKS